jgi:pimeloyl-ACP methyl ester carboxylesterase
VLAADLETEVAAPPPLALGPLYTKAAERIRRGEIDEGLKLTVDAIAGPGGWDRTPRPARQMLRDNAATLIGQIKEQRAPFAHADAEAIRAPTLLVAGEQSPASFHHILDGLESALSDSRRVVIPNASHSSNVDNPKAFERAVLTFLEDEDGRGASPNPKATAR